jgi:hypothetical protein
MDRTTELHYLISGSNQFGRVNLSRARQHQPAMSEADNFYRIRTLDLIRALKVSYDLDAPHL